MPSTVTATVAGSMRWPRWATSPSTRTRPWSISSSHTRRLPKPARARTFCRRSPPGSSGRVGGEATIGPEVVLELSGHLGTREEVLDRGQLLDPVQPEALQEEVGRAEQHRLARALGPPD